MAGDRQGSIEEAFDRIVRCQGEPRFGDVVAFERELKEFAGQPVASVVLLLAQIVRSQALAAPSAADAEVVFVNAKSELRKVLRDIKEVDRPHVVMMLHGIRTRGTWQKDLAPAISEAGMIPWPLDYGFFLAVELATPMRRRSKLYWFRDRYHEIKSQKTAARLSVVAHSFGTYISAESMEMFPEIAFDHMVFCGAIVKRDFPWDRLYERGQVVRALNDYGGEDHWANRVVRVVKDSGRSGIEGFATDHPCLTQRYFPRFRHSDYHHPSHYQSGWIPFLKGGNPGDAPIDHKASKNPHFLRLGS